MIKSYVPQLLKKMSFTVALFLISFITKADCVTASLSIQESRCVATGAITVNITNGVGPYAVDFITYPTEYTYVGPTSNLSLTGLAPGNYVVRIIDQGTAGCYVDYPAYVPGTYLQPNSFAVSSTSTYGCNNANNGTITSTLNGIEGRAPYTYQITAGPSGVGTLNSTGYFSGLSAGLYTVKLSDSCGNDQVRQVTIDNFVWSLGASALAKTACDNYVLNTVALTNGAGSSQIVPGVTYSIKQGTTVLASSTTLPIAFTNPDNTINNIVVCATDACGNELCNNNFTIADWSYSVAFSYTNCNTWSADAVTIYGSYVGPLTYGWVRDYNDTVWSNTIPFTITKTPPLTYFWSTFIVKDGCGTMKTQTGPFLKTWEYVSKTYDNCTQSTVCISPAYAYIAPVTYEISGSSIGTLTNPTGCFSGLADGYYIATVTDACGNTNSEGVTVSHDWQASGYSYYPCGIGTAAFVYTVPANATNPISMQIYDGSYNAIGAPIVYVNGGGYMYQEGLTPYTYYNFVTTDACGRADTLSFFSNGGSTALTHNTKVQELCINKGKIIMTAKSDHGGYHNWSYGKLGQGATSYVGYTYYTDGVEHTFTFDNVDTGTYWVRYGMEYCSGEYYYDTVTIKPYIQPSLRKSLGILCGSTAGFTNVIASAKGGIKPYTFEILQTVPVNNPQPTQAGNIFTLSGNYTLVRLKVTDSCGNSSLQDLAIRPLAPPRIRTFINTPTCVAPYIYMYVDSLIPAQLYEWKNPSGTVVSTSSGFTMNLPTTDTGIYTCRVYIPGTCYDTTATINVRNKDLQCKAVIGNYVWNDINKDGIQNSSEVGVAGVTVVLYDINNVVVGSTVTDAYGHYLFANLEPGTYHVGFTLPTNYVFSIPNATNDLEDCDVYTINGLTGNYVLAAGDTNLSVDAGIYIPTTAKASLGNRVWLDVDADGIQDANEVGVAGVTVTLYSDAGVVVGTTITDANGEYKFSNLTPGTYYVGFTNPVGYVLSNNIQGGDINIDSNPNPITGLTSTVTLVAGENNTSLDAGIHAQSSTSASLGNYVWNDVNNNGVQDANEAGVAGVTVTLYAADGVTVIATTITDEFGAYIFNNLTPGSYVVGFSNLPSGFVFSTQNAGGNNATDSDPNTTSGKTGVINLGPGQINTTVDAGLYNAALPTAALGNFVWFDRNRNGIQNTDTIENGVPGITVNLYNASNVFLGTTTTDINGFYIFNNLAAGDYFVEFTNLPAYYTFTTKDATADGNDSDPNVTTGITPLISLSNGEVNLTIDAGLVSADNFTFKATLGDIVWNDINNNGIQDVGENGVSGVTVTLYAADGITVLKTTVTDALGNYLFTGLDGGAYIVGFSNLPAGYTFSTANQGTDDELDGDADATSAGKTGVILLAEGEDNLSIDAGIHTAPGLASLGNFVWNDLNQNGTQDFGEPGVPGVQVVLFDATTNAVMGVTTTDPNGLYQFTGLNPGTYYVEFTNIPDGYVYTDPKQGGDDALDSDVDPFNGATANVTLIAGQNYPNLDAGIFTDKASLGNYVWNDANANGIQDAGEAGIPGVTVTLYNAGGIPVASAVTNAAGGYNFINLEPGTYSVGFTGIPLGAIFCPPTVGGDNKIDSDVNPATGKTGSITLVAGENNPTIDAGIYIPSGAGLGNYVWIDDNANGIQDANEHGIAGVTVTLYDVNGVAIKSTITDQNGAYSFPDLFPGTYSVGFTTIPTYFYNSDGNPMVVSFTTTDATTDGTDSDVNPATGLTPQYAIPAGVYNPTVDAGLKYSFVLPIPVDVQVIQKGCDINVTWKAVNEDGVAKYIVTKRKAVNNASFEQVGEVVANGNTNYNFIDTKVEQGSGFYYQLKVLQNDNTYLYTGLSYISINCASDDIAIYPNPTKDKLNINFGATKINNDVTIELRDMLGSIVFSKILNPTTNNVVIIDTKSFAAGQYFLQIHNADNQNFIRKVQIIK